MGTNQRATVRMTEAEITQFLSRSRVATLATNGPSGVPHLVAMWFGYLDGRIYFETKAKSQKAVNLRRDPTVVCMVEAGDTYDQLRGVSVEGTAHLIEDTADDEYWAAGINVYERYQGPYTEETRPFVEAMMNKRIVVRVDPVRVRSWDHRKLGLPAMPLGGTTSAFLDEP
ncbi:PPOX class probable F420-dependent enzyme [Kibdelosporangium banguiense]|uniref:PPOX class probable F420-dependent enzyme n=1 Tax=Kibdelosporangium banguiense TaxID=1365924 RepID=A0ABS4U130_9PSEU|nr:PPOX class F420-dependent oxidoreductase [Kibdelosporangium banguiense]MBP2330352.1 PPOX class probable F420-dependent enzyme [Kibdelosporangium banguiense]